MKLARKCSACGASSGPSAKFCRSCGATIDDADRAATDGGGSENDTGDNAAAPSTRPSARPSSFDDQRFFRELCWLCGLPLVVSVVYAIVVRFSGPSAPADAIATGAMASIAVGGALLNLDLVRSALRLPTGGDLIATLLVALIAAPSLSLAFLVLEHLGFGLYAAYLSPYLQDGWPLWIGYADIALVTPIAEELLYRGLVQPKLAQVIRPTEALIVQAALFAAAHLNPVILVTHFAMGLALGWVRRRSGSLFPGILLHGTWNAWVVWSAT